jgi:hypothetical protein
VSGRLSCESKVTVVSSVFGKQFSNSQASSGSAIALFTSKIFASTAWLMNFRLPDAYLQIHDLLRVLPLLLIKTTLKGNYDRRVETSSFSFQKTHISPLPFIVPVKYDCCLLGDLSENTSVKTYLKPSAYVTLVSLPRNACRKWLSSPDRRSSWRKLS